MNPGDLLKGRYAIEARVASGSTCDVYRAISTSSGTTVAVKSLKSLPTPSRMTRERFAWEGRTLCAVRHPNLVAGYEFCPDETSPYIVMEYVSGGDLAALISGQGRLRPAQAVSVALQIASGLDRLTERAPVLAHRDIKPRNLLISETGKVKIIDLGVARGIGGPWDGGIRMMGTPSYMAPEQWRSPSEVDVRADIYSLGCVLFEMATGHKAFHAEDRNRLEAMHLSARRPSLPRWTSGRRHLQPIIDRCLSTKPQGRFETPRELEHALRHAATQLVPMTQVRPETSANRCARSL